jgi:uncharacterized membrane protein SpoIIM required for sporulation
MIIDLKRFAEAGKPRWRRLEEQLDRLEQDPLARLTVPELEELHALYQHASADLAKVAPLASEPEMKRYLEWLVGRAYCEIHETRERRTFSFRRWFAVTLPRTFRRHWRPFALSVALTALGCAFGALALHLDGEAKAVLLPFAHLQISPQERVAREVAERGRGVQEKGSFSAQLMTHNTTVTLFAVALGMTFGLGTILLLFYNGVILGAVVYDYVTGGQMAFLLGWLLPHGAVEIPAILIGGQAAFVLGHALIGWGSRQSRRERLRLVGGDLVTLVCGAAVLLVWAGIVEAFFSQYHEPVVPYAAKIVFGITELALLAAFLSVAGRDTVE